MRARGIVAILLLATVGLGLGIHTERSNDPPLISTAAAATDRVETRGPIVGTRVYLDWEEAYAVDQAVAAWVQMEHDRLATEAWVVMENERLAVEAAAWIAAHPPRSVARAPIGAPRAPSYDGDGGAAACIRSGEQGAAGYATETGNGFSGAYQFTQSTWDATARRAGRLDLVGVRPSSASPADQDLLFWTLWADGAGRMNWPVAQRSC